MSKIKIKNFGPIKEGYLVNDGWFDINKVTVFIGNQGSGKSTVAKLISTMTWVEKALVRGDYDAKWFSLKNRLKNQFLNYHRLENYFPANAHTLIDYIGDAYRIRLENGGLQISEKRPNVYPLPQIMYVPSERNFVSYLKDAKSLDMISDSLKEFESEYRKAKQAMAGAMRLPINDVDVEYNKLNDVLYLKGKDYRIRIEESSSGFQSLVPLYLVSWYLSDSIKQQSRGARRQTGEELERFQKGVASIMAIENLTEEQRRRAISELAARFNKEAFINIVEEPEQNLFPSSQWEMLKSLLAFNNMNDGNKLVMTTHSPYLVNYLTLAAKAGDLLWQLDDKLKVDLNEIIPVSSTINPENLAIYELDENAGTIKALETYDGLPSDENELNEELGEANELFAQLLEIEQKL